MLIKIETLKDTISNKKLVEKSNYVFNIAVKEGDYVTPGTLLYEAKDLSKPNFKEQVLKSINNFDVPF